MLRSGRSVVSRSLAGFTAVALIGCLAGCSGTDPQLDEHYPFPSLSDPATASETQSTQGTQPSLDPAKVSEAANRVQAQLSTLLAQHAPSAEEMAALTALADEVVKGALARAEMTPEEFAQLSPEQVAEMVAEAAKASRFAVQVNLDELRNMTPEQRQLIAESAAVVQKGLVDQVAASAQAALGAPQPPTTQQTPATQPGTQPGQTAQPGPQPGTVRKSVRIGVNELGGYAASAAYLWVYVLGLAGYDTVIEVGSGAVLADKLNSDQIDVAFEPVPDFLEVDTAPLGVWSDGRLNVHGRAGLADTYPELANALPRFALNAEQMKSLAAVVSTRGVADPKTQEAAVQLWLVNHPELLTRPANN